MDCPNCAAQVEEGAALCPSCGFDLHTRVADEVRRLREAGRIEPGRVHRQEDPIGSGGSVAPSD